MLYSIFRDADRAAVLFEEDRAAIAAPVASKAHRVVASNRDDGREGSRGSPWRLAIGDWRLAIGDWKAFHAPAARESLFFACPKKSNQKK